MRTWSDEEPINIGTDVTIAELARLIADIVGFTGDFALIRQNRTAPRASCSMFPR
jgi:nucleoside-diphosphate-sugar epimerase